jgi:hypothetical protein
MSDYKKELTSIADHLDEHPIQSCTIYKFQARPPYEGFVLILIIIIIIILFIWLLISGICKSIY